VEPLIVIAALGVASIMAAKKAKQWYDGAALERRVAALNRNHAAHVEQQLRARQQQARQEHQRLNQLYARMQTALLQLDQAPDFQRAASVALQARDVSSQYRQHQFLRFRPVLIQHFTRRLTAGEDEQRLSTSLTALVQALGMADFEAQYIEAEARRRMPRPIAPQAESYEEQLRRLQTDHDQREATLRSLPGLDEEMREQLLEAEQTRFRDSLLALEAEPRGSAHVEAPMVSEPPL